jgi:hypothetical protein
VGPTPSSALNASFSVSSTPQHAKKRRKIDYFVANHPGSGRFPGVSAIGRTGRNESRRLSGRMRTISNLAKTAVKLTSSESTIKKIQYFQGFPLDEPTKCQYYSPEIGPVGGPGLLQGGS